MRDGDRQDRRRWRDVLAEYRANAGTRVPVTLPELKFMEKPLEDERNECAVAA